MCGAAQRAGCMGPSLTILYTVKVVRTQTSRMEAAVKRQISLKRLSDSQTCTRDREFQEIRTDYSLF